MKLIITQQDLMAGRLLPKGWYTCKCTKFETKISAKGNSTNFIPHLQVIDEGPGMGKLLKNYYNTLAPGNLVELMKAVGEDVGPGSEFDSDIVAAKMEGSIFHVLVDQEVYEGRLVNPVKAILAEKETVPFG